MSEQTGRFAWITRLVRVWLIAALVLVGLSLAATFAILISQTIWHEEAGLPWTSLAKWFLLILGELVVGVWLLVVYGLVRAMIAVETSAAETAAKLGRIETVLDDQRESILHLTELASLSDQAKSLIYREHEIEAIRETIHADLMRQDYKTAENLIESLERKLGYADEAARLREEMEASRRATLDEKIDTAITRIQQIVDRHDWARATRESERLLRLFPDNPKITALPERIRSDKSQHKRDLLQNYGEAVRKNDVDRSIELLKELDLYLTPQEGAALQESARGVFKARLHQLGVQFSISVTDQDWSEAIQAGEMIVEEFPNTRMAQEVREKMDLLRSHAAQTQTGEQTPQ